MEEVLFKKGDTVVITGLGYLTGSNFTVGNAYVLRADYYKYGVFKVKKDDKGEPNGYTSNPHALGLRLELYKETLQNKKQRLERELKEVNAEIAENEPKKGDWCVFWNNPEKIVIGTYLQEDITFGYKVDINKKRYHNCKKITDKDLLTKLNEINL